MPRFVIERTVPGVHRLNAWSFPRKQFIPRVVPVKQPAPTGLSIAPNGHAFSTTGETQEFVVKNNGQSTTGTLTTSIVNEPGTSTGDFTAAPDTCNATTLPAGDQCTLTVTLNVTGSKAATLKVADASDGAAVAILGGAAT